MARTVTYKRRTKTGKVTTVRRRVKGNGPKPKPKPKSASKPKNYAGKEVKVFTSTSRWVGEDGFNYQTPTKTEIQFKGSYRWRSVPKGYKVQSKKERFGPFYLRTKTVTRLVKK